MSKKDYIKIAKLIDAEIPFVEGDDPDLMDSEAYGRMMAAKNIAEGMADIFVADNPNFDRKRFLVACGVAS